MRSALFFIWADRLIEANGNIPKNPQWIPRFESDHLSQQEMAAALSVTLYCAYRIVPVPPPELSILAAVSNGMSIEFNFTPELHLVDGRIIRNIEDAIVFAREQEARPGVDRRDEVLHALERARGREEAHAAAHLFLRWLEELEMVD
jgi:hypothetical protein